MAAFSSFVDSFYLQNNPSTIKFCDFLEQPNNAHLYHHQNLDHSTKISDISNNEANMNTIDTSSIITGNSSDQITQEPNPMHKKRKGRVGSLANSAQSKDMREVKGKKQKEVQVCKEKKKSKKKATEEPPTGYIHVRARRGQATDSHSLAERVRRERISERMKLLQSIVPGCDKVTGKALMLDEIINYVQSLQHQVEFLSLKLASVNPMFYDFGMDLESFMLDTDQNTSSLPSPMENMQECSPTTSNNYTLLDNSANSLLFQQSQIPNVLSQGNRQVLWEMEEQRLKIMNQSGFNNLFSFH